MTRFLFLLVIAGLSIRTNAQVPNNKILDRFTLVPNADPISSSTANSTVEWNCINKALTNKCLVYHNDQWFNFSIPKPGAYFINISGQKCRDLRGIQLIIIEGNPCETKTYRILQCIPQIHQDDVFVQLDSLKPQTQHLLNIDGFLGDFCEFEIQVSEKPNGLPRHLQVRDTTKAEMKQNGRLIKLNWTVSEDKIDQIQSFKIYRTQPNHVKSDLIAEQMVSRNAYGAYILNYSVTDSLQIEGMYMFRIFGIAKQTLFPSLLTTRKLQYTKPKPKIVPQRSVGLNLVFEASEKYNVMVYDKAGYQLLKKKVKPEDVTG